MNGTNVIAVIILISLSGFRAVFAQEAASPDDQQRALIGELLKNPEAMQALEKWQAKQDVEKSDLSSLKKDYSNARPEAKALLLPKAIHISLTNTDNNDWGYGRNGAQHSDSLIRAIVKEAPKDAVEQKVKESLPEIKRMLAAKPTSKNDPAYDSAYPNAWAHRVDQAMNGTIISLKDTTAIRAVIPDLIKIATNPKHPSKSDALIALRDMGIVGERIGFAEELDISKDEGSFSSLSKDGIETEILVREAQKKLIEARSKDLINDFRNYEAAGYGARDKTFPGWQSWINDVKVKTKGNLSTLDKQIEKLKFELKAKKREHGLNVQNSSNNFANYQVAPQLNGSELQESKDYFVIQ